MNNPEIDEQLASDDLLVSNLDSILANHPNNLHDLQISLESITDTKERYVKRQDFEKAFALRAAGRTICKRINEL